MFYSVAKYIPFWFLRDLLYINVVTYFILNDSIPYPIYQNKKGVVGLLAKDTITNINTTQLLTLPRGWC